MYSYKQFQNEAKLLVETSSLYKYTINKCSYSDIEYLKASILIDNYDIIMNLNIMFNDSYSSPILYFSFYDINSSKIISIEEYKSLIQQNNQELLQDINIDNTFSILSKQSNTLEISKETFPLTGSLLYSLHLCSFNSFISKLTSNNTLQLWIEIILSFFHINKIPN